MRCRTHPTHSGIGVCAFCLRERLSALTASPAACQEVSSPDCRVDPERSSATRSPPPLLCHLSPFSSAGGKNRAAKKLSLWSPIRANPGPKKADCAAGFSKPSGSTTSWRSALSLGRTMRNKKTSPHVQPVSGRGMSPAVELSPGRGAAPIPSPLWRRQSPHRFSSFGLCLSPMVRPIPGNRRAHAPPETAFSGEIRGTFNRRCGGDGAVITELSPSLVTNRSRKLVDLGKVW